MARRLSSRTIDRGDRRALLVTLAVVLLLHRLMSGRFKDMHLITAALVLPLGYRLRALVPR